MKHTFLAGMLLVPAFGLAGSGNWSPTKVSALQIAQNADAKIRSLTGVSLKFTADCDVPNVGFGQIGLGVGAFKTPGKFKIEYPQIGKTEREGIEIGALIGDGKRVATYQMHRWTRPAPLGAAHALPADVPAAWLLNGPRLLFFSQNGESPLVALVKQAQKQGLQVSSAERELNYKGHTIRNYRIVVSRSAAEAKRKGELRYEIVVDARRWLPVTLDSRSGGSLGKPARVVWRGDWNLAPNQSFPADTFKIKAG